MSMAQGNNPSFRTPPVIETVLGTEFSRVEKWDVRHFGLFWHQMREHFPGFEVQSPIRSGIESFDKPREVESAVSLHFSTDRPDPRCWYVSGDGRELIQLQDSRFIFNWRKLDSDAPYPRYADFVRPAFERHWPAYLQFLRDYGLDSPQVVQCEVSYVNHLPKGIGWESIADWPKVFKGISQIDGFQFLPPPESALLNVSYLMPDRSGRLRVSVVPAIRNADGIEIIKLVLTARGRPDSSDLSSLLKWFDLGHDWVVRGFADITTDRMHALWQRER